jgi:hypothetical protein
MNNSILSYVGWLLLFATLGFYVFGIYEAIRLSWSALPGAETINYHPVLSSTIGAIQALLLANLGMLLGVSVSTPNSNIAHSLKLSASTANPELAPPPPMDIKDKIQLFALAMYIISLIACLLTWIVNNFSSDSKDVVSIIPESGKMFIGVVLAYLTAVLKK